jgi:hypothetical protein
MEHGYGFPIKFWLLKLSELFASKETGILISPLFALSPINFTFCG